MNRMRGKLTYANLMSSLAVFLVLAGGTAFAASQLEKESVGTKQLKKEAVSLAKIKTAAKESLRGQVGAPGAKGATGPQGIQGLKGDPGAPGSAVAFVEVFGDNATISGEHAKNITQSNLSEGTNNGIICFKNLPFKWDVVSAIREGGTNDAGLVNYTRGAGFGCPSGTQLTITSQVFNSGTFNPSSNRVMITFY